MNSVELKIGDKVNFVVGTSLLEGIITKFYKNEYNHEECSVKTEYKTYPHILLHRVSKVKTEDIDGLKKQLQEKDKEIETLKKALELSCERISELLPFHFITKEQRINNFIKLAKENINGREK